MSFDKKKVYRAFVLTALLAFGAGVARGEEPVQATSPPRAFASFISDAETSHGLWAEVGGGYARQSDLNAGAAFVLAAYGGELWEAGGLIPAGVVETHSYYGGNSTDGGLGDIRLWGKVLPLRTDFFDLGGGAALILPTASNGFGIGELGLSPFVTAGVHLGPVAVRANGGYSAYFSGASDFNSADYGLGAFVPLGDRVTLRLEAVGSHVEKLHIDPVSIAPGVDIRFRTGDVELLLRPTAVGGVTSDSPDFQILISVAVAWLR